MNKKNLSNVSFAWASVIFGTVGMGLLEAKDYLLGAVFVVLSLATLVAREKLKID